MQSETVDRIPTNKLAWNPKAIGGIAFFFTFLPAGVMYAINYERLGYPEKKTPGIVFTIVGFALYILVIALLPDFPGSNSLFMGFNIGMTAFFFQGQKKLFEQHLQQGGGKAPIGPPLAFSFLLLVILFGGVFMWGYQEVTRYEEKFTQACRLFDSNEYTKAEPIFKEYKAKYPEEAAAPYNLALIYLRTDRIDLAKRELNEVLRLNPQFENTKELLKEIEESGAQTPK